MAIVPVPVPASAVKRWFENLDKIISAAGELSAELVKAHIDEIRVKRADHERRHKAIASAEALIPSLNSLKFYEGGIADTARELLTAPTGHVYEAFETQIKASSAALKDLRSKISDSPQLEARLGTHMQIVRQIEQWKRGQFTDRFSGNAFNRYAHAGKPMKKEQAEPLVAKLDELVATVNGKIDAAVKLLTEFVEAELRGGSESGGGRTK